MTAQSWGKLFEQTDALMRQAASVREDFTRRALAMGHEVSDLEWESRFGHPTMIHWWAINAGPETLGSVWIYRRADGIHLASAWHK
jgi:hypothetical protein